MPQSDKEKAVMAILAHKNKVEKVENNKRMLFLKKKLDLEDLNKARQYDATTSVPYYMKRKLDLEDVHDPDNKFYHSENYYLPFTPEHIPHAHQKIDLKKLLDLKENYMVGQQSQNLNMKINHTLNNPTWKEKTQGVEPYQNMVEDLCLDQWKMHKIGFYRKIQNSQVVIDR